MRCSCYPRNDTSTERRVIYFSLWTPNSLDLGLQSHQSERILKGALSKCYFLSCWCEQLSITLRAAATVKLRSSVLCIPESSFHWWDCTTLAPLCHCGCWIGWRHNRIDQSHLCQFVHCKYQERQESERGTWEMRFNSDDSILMMFSLPSACWRYSQWAFISALRFRMWCYVPAKSRDVVPLLTCCHGG